MRLFPRVDRCCVHSYLPRLIRDGGVVIDFGANRGEFAQAVALEFEVVVHAVEPVPDFHSRLGRIPGLRLHRTCLAPAGGQVELAVPDGGDATLFPVGDSEPPKVTVPSVTLEAFFIREGLQEVDLVKLDIEGAELPVLEQAPAPILRRARQITVEFHDWMIPGTTSRVEDVKRRLCDIGFYCIRFSRNNGDVLFVRRDLLSFVQYASVVVLVRNVMGARRLMERLWKHPPALAGR